MSHDAIVIGGGHNGLVCATYLARGGLRTLVLERRNELGGLATLAHNVGRLSGDVVRDLDLERHGLEFVQPAALVFAPQPDGGGVTLWADANRTFDELSRRDAEDYAKADGRLAALAAALGAMTQNVPPDLTSSSLANALGRATQMELLRVLPMSVHDLVGEWFESDALRALVAARGLLFTGFGPPMPGTAAVLVNDSIGAGSAICGQTVYARGGPSGLSAALASAAQAAGVEVRCGSEVVGVRRVGRVANGVALADGTQMEAPVVVSSLDPRTTFLELIEPEVLGPRLSWRASNIRQRGATSAVNFALRDLPEFPAARGDAERLSGRIVIAPSMRYLDRATRPKKYGEIPDEPLLVATLQPDGMSVIVNGTPRDLRRGTWDERRDELGDAVTRVLDSYAPGFADLVESREVITPLDIERDYGADGGHPMHAETGLDQWFVWRPLHGYARYRLPLDGLYLCGSGASPGGGVTGGPGRLAAQEVLADIQESRLRVSA